MKFMTFGRYVLFFTVHFVIAYFFMVFTKSDPDWTRETFGMGPPGLTPYVMAFGLMPMFVYMVDLVVTARRKTLWSWNTSRILDVEQDDSGQMVACIIAGPAQNFSGIKRVETDGWRATNDWHQHSALPWHSFGQPGGVGLVGEHIIAVREDPDGIMAVDPHTGAVKWESVMDDTIDRERTPCFRGDRLHLVEENTGRWRDVDPESGATIEEGAYDTDSEWEHVYDSGCTRLSKTSLNSEDPDAVESLAGKVGHLDLHPYGRHLGYYGPYVLFVDSSEKFGGDRSVALVVLEEESLEVVARFECDQPATDPEMMRCEQVGEQLLVVLDGLSEHSTGDRPRTLGWIIDPESWRLLAELPNTCIGQDGDEAMVFDARGQRAMGLYL